VPKRTLIGQSFAVAAVAASALCLAAPTNAATLTVALSSLAFSHVPAGFRIAAVAWEDRTDQSLSLTVPAPQGLVTVTVAKARAEALTGPALLPGGRGWFIGAPEDMLGTRGQAVFEFRGPAGQVLCAASPVLRIPARGTWHAVTVPTTTTRGTITLRHYTWIRSLDGRWSHRAPTIEVYPTPAASGYTLGFSYLPLAWQLETLRFVAPRLTLTANVLQTLQHGGTGKYFSYGSLGWSFFYPSADAGKQGRIEARFAYGSHASAWIRTKAMKLRG
jgi:hypothetical protein